MPMGRNKSESWLTVKQGKSVGLNEDIPNVIIFHVIQVARMWK